MAGRGERRGARRTTPAAQLRGASAPAGSSPPTLGGARPVGADPAPAPRPSGLRPGHAPDTPRASSSFQVPPGPVTAGRCGRPGPPPASAQSASRHPEALILVPPPSAQAQRPTLTFPVRDLLCPSVQPGTSCGGGRRARRRGSPRPHPRTQAPIERQLRAALSPPGPQAWTLPAVLAP